MRKFSIVLTGSLLALGLTACDLIRYPGDGGPPPETPSEDASIPPGAPGPPPPSEPVDDPYGTGTDDNTDTPTDDAADTTDLDEPPQTDSATDPDTVEPPLDDTDGTDTSLDTTDTATTDTDVPDATDTPPDTTDDSTDTTDASDTTPPPEPEIEPAFAYFGPGQLLPGTGQGNVNQVVQAPEIIFPIKSSPAYLQSMVFTFGGGVGGGDQCDARNFAYPWRDNFCETRSANRNTPFCPTSRVHQGQDIRVGTPEECNTMRRTNAADRALHEVVAVEDGVISNVGTYSVNLRSGGRIYKYMHMNMKKLNVTAGQAVTKGQSLGYVSNDFGGTPTTFHLHFEIVQNTEGGTWSHVPPYLSLVEAYERREEGVGELIDAGDIAVASAPVIIPEGMEIIE